MFFTVNSKWFVLILSISLLVRAEVDNHDLLATTRGGNKKEGTCDSGDDDACYELILPTLEVFEARFWHTVNDLVLKNLTCDISLATFKEQIFLKINKESELDKALDSRIIGGRLSKPSEAPYQVGIFRKGRGLLCGGTLYNHNTVITAAHCLPDSLTIDDLVFVLGKVDLLVAERLEQLVTGKSFVIHPEYDSQSYVNDVAVIKLNKRICYNSNIQPLPLATMNSTINGTLVISGWGYTLKRKRREPRKLKYYPTRLRRTQIQFIPKMDCISLFRSIQISNHPVASANSQNTFCAGVRSGNADNCQGDSGGPVACKDDEGKRYLCGIVSSGYGCGQQNTPALYSDVAGLSNWIEDNVGDSGPGSDPDETCEEETSTVPPVVNPCGQCG